MDKEQKIYTKKGDNGTTSLIGGSRTEKSNLRIEAYGTLDELNSFVGLIRDFSVDEEQKKTIHTIQTHIFIAESLLAADYHLTSYVVHQKPVKHQ